ncbi:MAG: hypothetical protein WAL63_16990, partial [Solirubrobacteraceae bacterium]
TLLDGAGAVLINQTAQGIWQLQVGCIFDCADTTQDQQAQQSNTTVEVVGMTTSLPGAAAPTAVNNVIALIWQLQVGCLFWCYDAVEVQTAGSENAVAVVSVPPASGTGTPVAAAPMAPAPVGPSPVTSAPVGPPPVASAATPAAVGPTPPSPTAASSVPVSGDSPPPGSVGATWSTTALSAARPATGDTGTGPAGAATTTPSRSSTRALPATALTLSGPAAVATGALREAGSVESDPAIQSRAPGRRATRRHAGRTKAYVRPTLDQGQPTAAAGGMDVPWILALAALAAAAAALLASLRSAWFRWVPRGPGNRP